MEDKQPNGKEDKNKVRKAFEKALIQLGAILAKGDDGDLFKPKKIKDDDLTLAIKELVKEEKEALIESVKKEAKSLIQEKRDFDKRILQKRKEFDKVIEDEQKKFTEKAQSLLKLVDNIKDLEEGYRKTLLNAGVGQVNDPVEEDPDPE